MLLRVVQFAEKVETQILSAFHMGQSEAAFDDQKFLLLFSHLKCYFSLPTVQMFSQGSQLFSVFQSIKYQLFSRSQSIQFLGTYYRIKLSNERQFVLHSTSLGISFCKPTPACSNKKERVVNVFAHILPLSLYPSIPLDFKKCLYYAL